MYVVEILYGATGPVLIVIVDGVEPPGFVATRVIV
jgi:hypothetical protein